MAMDTYDPRPKKSRLQKGKRVSCFSFLFAMNFLCSFSQAQAEQKSPKWEHDLKGHAVRKEWSLFNEVVGKAIKGSLDSKRLKKLIIDIDSPVLTEAAASAKKMKRLSADLGLSFPELFRLSLFIETEQDLLVNSSKGYFSRKSTGLPRAVEYNRESKQTFIHLQTHGISQIGKGAKKVVTKSILYTSSKPEIVAHCSTKIPMPKEVAAVKALQGLPGIVKAKAFTERKDSKGEAVYGILCKYYRGGDLEHFLKLNKNLSLKQKMKIALDILKGIESMHENGYVHRDLNIRNYLVNVVKKGGKRELKAVVADFGRTTSIEKVKGELVQWNSSYVAPEGIFRHKLEGKDYVYTDIYAVGCALYNLLTGKKAPWVNKEWIKDTKQSAKYRYHQYVHSLRAFQYRANSKNRSKHSQKARFKRLILSMCNASPKKRGEAKKLRASLEKIVKNSK